VKRPALHETEVGHAGDIEAVGSRLPVPVGAPDRLGQRSRGAEQQAVGPGGENEAGAAGIDDLTGGLDPLDGESLVIQGTAGVVLDIAASQASVVVSW